MQLVDPKRVTRGMSFGTSKGTRYASVSKTLYFCGEDGWEDVCSVSKSKAAKSFLVPFASKISISSNFGPKMNLESL